MRYRLGMHGKLYINATPFTDNEVEDVEALTDEDICGGAKDVECNLSTAEADTNTRETAADGWESTQPTLKNGEITFDFLRRTNGTSQPDYEILRDAWLAGDEIAVAALDAPMDEGGEGPAGNYTVVDFSRGEQLKEAVNYKVKLKPSSQMQWFEPSSS